MDGLAWSWSFGVVDEKGTTGRSAFRQRYDHSAERFIWALQIALSHAQNGLNLS